MDKSELFIFTSTPVSLFVNFKVDSGYVNAIAPHGYPGADPFRSFPDRETVFSSYEFVE